MTTGTGPASSRDILRLRGLLCQGSQVGLGLGGRGGVGLLALLHASGSFPDAGHGFVAPGLPFAAVEVLFRRDEITPYAIMSPKSTMSNQLFAYAEILENAVQDIFRAHGTGDFT